jgi:hypothetical protein
MANGQGGGKHVTGPAHPARPLNTPPPTRPTQDGQASAEEVLRSLALDGAVNARLGSVDGAVWQVGGRAAGINNGERSGPKRALLRAASVPPALLPARPTPAPPPRPQAFDANGSGTVDAAEWGAALGDIGGAKGASASEYIFERVDALTDSKGQLREDAFANALGLVKGVVLSGGGVPGF